MVFNMVANQSTGPVRDHKGLSAALTKLRVDSKDKKRVWAIAGLRNSNTMKSVINKQ